MSQSESDAGGLAKRLDAVTPPSMPRPNAEMDTIGWAIFLGLLMILLPLLPFLVIVWLVARVIGFVERQTQ